MNVGQIIDICGVSTWIKIFSEDDNTTVYEGNGLDTLVDSELRKVEVLYLEGGDSDTIIIHI